MQNKLKIIMEKISQDFNLSADPVKYFTSRLQDKYKSCITRSVTIPAVNAKLVDFPNTLDQRIKTALQKKGINQLYLHQRQAWDSVANQNHTVIITPTASGKTLCYNLPVLQSVLTDKTKALYLFPTKALSQDQQAEILTLNQYGNLGVRVSTFDGDTPGDARKAVRTYGDIVISNPDMLHQGILPHHTKWAQFFENLQFVVIDEMHNYRGVFGSHLANVLRRLIRICHFYGSFPQFIFCSATIANPQQLAEQLIGQKVHCINDNGAPQGEKHLLFYNPPVVNPDLGIRASARSQSTKIARMAIKQGLQNIVFAQSRIMVEVITKYLKDVYDKDPRKPARIQSYRGGYLPNQRRQTEKKMRSGNMACVVSTSALELGVDIGSLDVCILNGYPGTIAATWQRLGRAGRRNRSSLGVLVANSTALDQYLIQNPQYFLDSSPEYARIDPDQLLILLDHIRCAAFELPFSIDEKFGGNALSEFLQYLCEEEILHLENQRYHWVADAYPANTVNLRGDTEGNFVVVDTSNGKQDIIAETDYHSAADTLYEGAIYLIQASPWQVEKLDWKGRKAFVTKTDADYYTDAIDYTKLKILEEFQCQKNNALVVSQGEVHLVRRISGYKKIRYYTHENVGFGKINLPDQEKHTTAIWWQLDSDLLDRTFKNRWQALDGFLGAAYVLHHVAALLSMSEVRDIGRAVGNADATWFASVGELGRGKASSFNGDDVDINHMNFHPTLFLYDQFPGGLGLSNGLFENKQRLVISAKDVITQCACHTGCPACVGPINRETQVNELSAKATAVSILELIISHEYDENKPIEQALGEFA